MSNNEHDEDKMLIEISGTNSDPEQAAEENKFLFRTGKDEDYMSPFATNLLKRMDELGIGRGPETAPPAKQDPIIMPKPAEPSIDPDLTAQIERNNRILSDIIQNFKPEKPEPFENLLDFASAYNNPDTRNHIQMASYSSEINNSDPAGWLIGTGENNRVAGKIVDGIKEIGQAVEGAHQNPHHRIQEPGNPLLQKGAQTLVGSPLPEKHAELERQSSGQHRQHGDPEHKGMGGAYLDQTAKSPEFQALDQQGQLVRDMAKTQAGANAQYFSDRLGGGAVGTAGSIAGALSMFGPRFQPVDTAMYQYRHDWINKIQPGDGKIIFDAASNVLAKTRQDIENKTPEELRKLEYLTTDPNKSAFLSPVRMVGDIFASIPDAVVVSRLGFSLAQQAGAKAHSAALAAGLTPEMASLAAQKASEHMMTYATAMTNGMQSGGSQYSDTFHKFMAMEGEKIEKHPQYQELLKSGKSPEDAQVAIAQQEAQKDGTISGLVSTACSFVSDRFVKSVRTGDEGAMTKVLQDKVTGLLIEDTAKDVLKRPD